MSPNEAETYRHVCTFFTDAELGLVNLLGRFISTLLLSFLPSLHFSTPDFRFIAQLDPALPTLPAPLPSLSLVKSLQLGPQPISCFCLIKPDGVTHFPKILQRLNQVCDELSLCDVAHISPRKSLKCWDSAWWACRGQLRRSWCEHPQMTGLGQLRRHMLHI